MELTLKNVRLSYADLWVPKPPADGKGEAKYGATFIIDPKKNAEEVKAIRSAVKKVAKDKWGGKADNILRVIEGDNQKFCWFEEDKLNSDGDVVDGFEGMFFLNTKSPIQPGLYDRDKSELSRADGKPYSGCYVVAKVDVWAQDNTHGKGMRCQLKGVQFLRDGDSFGGGTRSKADDFEDLSDLGEEDEAPKARGRKDEDEDAPRSARKPAQRQRQPEPEDEEEDAW